LTVIVSAKIQVRPRSSNPCRTSSHAPSLAKPLRQWRRRIRYPSLACPSTGPWSARSGGSTHVWPSDHQLSRNDADGQGVAGDMSGAALHQGQGPPGRCAASVTGRARGAAPLGRPRRAGRGGRLGRRRLGRGARGVLRRPRRDRDRAGRPRPSAAHDR
jgi:hypothetical protein